MMKTNVKGRRITGLQIIEKWYTRHDSNMRPLDS